MDLNNSLRNENIIPESLIIILEKKGINTVSDLINTDVNDFHLFEKYSIRNRLSGIKEILKYKYLGENFSLGGLLDQKFFDVYEFDLFLNSMENLGFSVSPNTWWKIKYNKMLESNHVVKIIDIIKIYSDNLMNEKDKCENLKMFYLQYYSIKLKKEAARRQMELDSLYKQRDRLNKLISNKLIEIAALGDGDTSHLYDTIDYVDSADLKKKSFLKIEENISPIKDKYSDIEQKQFPKPEKSVKPIEDKYLSDINLADLNKKNPFSTLDPTSLNQKQFPNPAISTKPIEDKYLSDMQIENPLKK